MPYCEACGCPQNQHGDAISTRGWATTPGGNLCTAFAPTPARREPPTSDDEQRTSLYRKWLKHGASVLAYPIPAIQDPPAERQRRREQPRTYRGVPSHSVVAILFIPGRGSVLVDIGS